MASYGLKPADLAREADISAATLSRYLSDKRKPDLEYLIKIANYFNVSLDWIIGRSDDRYNKFTVEEQRFIDRYNISKADDKMVIDLILSKYDTKDN